MTWSYQIYHDNPCVNWSHLCLSQDVEPQVSLFWDSSAIVEGTHCKVFCWSLLYNALQCAQQVGDGDCDHND